ncbi:MAG: pyridoxal phosphate-dependent aminotransferase [Gemmatimonadetes bacterium]|nr:pyridoxal phosphate-dependent aminotransferase [Gemmatimonadota bacterium]
MPGIRSRLPDTGTTIFTVMSQLAAETGAVNLGQGFPDFDIPDALAELLARAVRDGKNQYAPMSGLPVLREAIAAKTEVLYGRRVDPAAEITVTSGATEAIFNAILAAVQPGDEAIVLDPSYDSYEPGIVMAGGRCVHVALRDADFSVDWEAVRAAVTPRTRLIIVNSPHNPSGAVWSADDVAQLAELAEAHDLLVISDEVYEHIVFDGRRHESALCHEALAARTFVVSSFGKTYHCTGWKVGYCIAPAPLTAEFRKVHQYNTFATNTPAQWAFAGMLRDHPAHHAQLGAFYESKRDRFRAQLEQTRLRPYAVGGSYFQLVDYSAISDLSDREFANWLCMTHGVASIPLSPFYASPPEGQRIVRLCFAKHEATLDAAIARLEKV